MDKAFYPGIALGTISLPFSLPEMDPHTQQGREQ